MDNITYTVVTRSQHAKRGRSMFSGPDTYVAVVGIPEGVECPYVLNRKVLAKRGISFTYFGEGYREHIGPRSMLGKLIANAERFAREREKCNH